MPPWAARKKALPLTSVSYRNSVQPQQIVLPRGHGMVRNALSKRPDQCVPIDTHAHTPEDEHVSAGMTSMLHAELY